MGGVYLIWDINMCLIVYNGELMWFVCMDLFKYIILYFIMLIVDVVK